MPLEIERRFLVRGEPWSGRGPGTPLEQGYLLAAPERTLRVRLAGERAWLTLKLAVTATTRAEYEYAIPLEHARELLAACGDAVVAKTRHGLEHAGRRWTIDVFAGASAGLVLAELELEAEDAPFERPPWLGPEVTADGRYTSAALALRPWSEWTDKG